MSFRGIACPVLGDPYVPGGVAPPLFPQIAPPFVFTTQNYPLSLLAIDSSGVVIGADGAAPGTAAFWGYGVGTGGAVPFAGLPGVGSSFRILYRVFREDRTEVEYSIPANPDLGTTDSGPLYALASVQTLGDVVEVTCAPSLYTDSTGAVFVALAYTTVPGTTDTLPHVGGLTQIEQWLALPPDYCDLDETVWNLTGLIFRWFDDGVAPGPRWGEVGARAFYAYLQGFAAFDFSGVYSAAAITSFIAGVTTSVPGVLSFLGANTGFPSTAHLPVAGYTLTSQSATTRVWTAPNGIDTVTMTLSGAVDLSALLVDFPLSAQFAQAAIAGFPGTPPTQPQSGGGTVDVSPVTISGFPLKTVAVDGTGHSTTTIAYTTETFMRLVLNLDGTMTLDSVDVSDPEDVDGGDSILLTMAAASMPLGDWSPSGVTPSNSYGGLLVADIG